MAAVANVVLNVDAGKALASLRSVEAAANQVSAASAKMATALGGAIQGLGNKVNELGKSMTSLAGVAATVGAGAAVSGFVKAGVEAERTQKKIKALADSYKETDQVNRLAQKAATDFGLGNTAAANAVSDLYGRLRPMGISLQDISTTFNGFNKAALMMNLTSADTAGVMLQLSQAMGSGKLQGDELRSIMERLPMVGQAVAKVMGVTVGEIKQLGADGAITTEILIQAMQELNKLQPPPPDAFKLFQKAIQDLNTAIGQQLMPVFTPLVQKLTELVAKFQELGVGKTIAEALLPLGQALLGLIDAFMRLDPGTQKFIIQLGALLGVFALIVVPLGIFLQTLGTIITVVGSVVTALGGLSIFATIAGWLGAVGPILAGVIAFLTGPAGLIIAIGLVVAALIAFREPIMKFFGQLAEGFKSTLAFINTQFIQPAKTNIGQFVQGLQSTFAKIGEFITAPFKAALNVVRGVVNQILNAVGNSIRSVVNAINGIIRGANAALSRLKLPQIPTLPMPNIPQFAKGGVVTGPTLAMVGEGNEPEYIVPQSKAAGFAQNWIGGKRGAGAIPGFANGGMAMPSSANVSIQTGPVTQMNGTNFVTTQDLGRAVQAGVDQTLALLAGDINVRAGLGLI